MSDVVNHPPHYKANGIEVIEVIESFALNFRLGNLIKYILRAGRKVRSDDLTVQIEAALEDLRKARWYLDREIAVQESTLRNWSKLDRAIERNNRRFDAKRRRK